MKTAVIYARVSSEQQKEANTIASQTAALVEFARSQGYDVPAEYIFQDEGYSGGDLLRPGLERVRDLAAEGHIQTVLALSPDRLSRKYAYQVLLIEEFARHGVDTVFVSSPQSNTPEDHLLLQFQGMIAEYERAQILERSRRGKRHRAKQGQINVLGGAPYGYRYIKKSDEASASYEVIPAEADAVRTVFEMYTVAGLSIAAIGRRLDELKIPTKKGSAQWKPSCIWAMLRNPAYHGVACFGKTRIAPRQRITRPLRLRGGIVSRNSASHELPRDEWIEIPVPALISEATFALAQELLARNKKTAARRTIEPSIVQGLVCCRSCGYALCRTSTRTSARKISYYRCLGSDAWRYRGKALCSQKPIRQDLLDETVWSEVLRLLEDPTLIQSELDRRLKAASDSEPTKRHQQTLERDLIRTQKGIERLLTAYQEELLSLEELRRRMPELRKRENTVQTQLQSLNAQVADQATYLRLAQTLSTFLGKLRTNAQTLDVQERQRILRLLVREVIVGNERITIRHSIPIHQSSPIGNGSVGSSDSLASSRTLPQQTNVSYLLRSGREWTTLRHANLSGDFDDLLDEVHDLGVLDTLGDFVQ
jgi:site-specific DNA recombinase